MDVAFFATSASLSVYLPKRVFGYQSQTEQMCMAVAIGLSLGLFSLSLLEAVPESSLIIVSLDDENGSTNTFGIRISALYWVFLWMLSLVILVLFPCLAGIALAQSFGNLWHSGNDERKYRAWRKAWMACPWWIRFVGVFVGLVVRSSTKVIQTLFCRKTSADPVLAKSYSEDEIRMTASGDVEFQGLVKTATARTTKTTSFSVWSVLACIFAVALAFTLSSLVGPLVVHTASDKSTLSVIVSWLCAVGLTISSLLNGFGSVSMPYSCLSGLYLKPVRPEVFTKMESELQSVREAVVKKRTELREMKVTIESGSTNSNTSSSVFSSFTNKVRRFTDIGEDLTNRRQILQTEIDFLNGLSKDMKEEIDELRLAQAKAAAARTTNGRVRSYIGILFSIILLVRLVSAAISIWNGYALEGHSKHHSRNSHKDMITSALLWLTGHDLVSKKEYNMISQAVSLGLTAMLSFTQIRFFLRVVAIVHKQWIRLYRKCLSSNTSVSSSSNDDGSSLATVAEGVFSQIFAGATGCYFLSCIVVIKMMVPEEFCRGFASALGGRDIFTIHESFVNQVYAWSASVSVFVLAMLFGIQRQNNFRHATSSNDGRKLSGSEAV